MAIKISLFLGVSKDLDKSDKNIDGIHIHMECIGDWVKSLLSLGSVEDGLSVVENESTE